jgi:hypothetical protein
MHEAMEPDADEDRREVVDEVDVGWEELAAWVDGTAEAA